MRSDDVAIMMIYQRVGKSSLPLFFLCMMSLCGCYAKSRPADRPVTSPTSGVVTYKGKAIQNAQISFFPEGDGEAGAAVSGSAGRFTVSTYERNDGAVIGQHVVTVNVPPSEPVVPGFEQEARRVSPIPVKYLDRATSPIKIEVKSGVANDFELTLED
ncbi:MAG TPA: hypothetical protein VNQ76_10180 [Planctomicrobium sp.]|nr:hypothetical protein [Planctomicrobium sp.]